MDVAAELRKVVVSSFGSFEVLISWQAAEEKPKMSTAEAAAEEVGNAGLHPAHTDLTLCRRKRKLWRP